MIRQLGASGFEGRILTASEIDVHNTFSAGQGHAATVRDGRRH